MVELDETTKAKVLKQVWRAALHSPAECTAAAGVQAAVWALAQQVPVAAGPSGLAAFDYKFEDLKLCFFGRRLSSTSATATCQRTSS